MSYSPMNYLLKHVDNKYILTIVVAKRARQITEEGHANDERSIKAVTLALEEIANNEQSLHGKRLT